MVLADLGEHRSVVADGKPFGIDVHQGTGLPYGGKRDGTCARSFPTRVAHGYDHVTGICEHGKHFDLARDTCGQGGRFGSSSGEVGSGEIEIGSS